MPVRVRRIGLNWRVVNSETSQIERFKTGSRKGQPVDGGGYDSKEEAVKMVQAINLRLLRKAGRRDVPPPKERTE